MYMKCVAIVVLVIQFLAPTSRAQPLNADRIQVVLWGFGVGTPPRPCMVIWNIRLKNADGQQKPILSHDSGLLAPENAQYPIDGGKRSLLDDVQKKVNELVELPSVDNAVRRKFGEIAITAYRYKGDAVAAITVTSVSDERVRSSAVELVSALDKLIPEGRRTRLSDELEVLKRGGKADAKKSENP